MGKFHAKIFSKCPRFDTAHRLCVQVEIFLRPHFWIPELPKDKASSLLKNVSVIIDGSASAAGPTSVAELYKKFSIYLDKTSEVMHSFHEGVIVHDNLHAGAAECAFSMGEGFEFAVKNSTNDIVVVMTDGQATDPLPKKLAVDNKYVIVMCSEYPSLHCLAYYENLGDIFFIQGDTGDEEIVADHIRKIQKKNTMPNPIIKFNIPEYKTAKAVVTPISNISEQMKIDFADLDPETLQQVITMAMRYTFNTREYADQVKTMRLMHSLIK